MLESMNGDDDVSEEEPMSFEMLICPCGATTFYTISYEDGQGGTENA
jgi:hypothetical protein